MIAVKILRSLLLLIPLFGYHYVIEAQEDRPEGATEKVVSSDSTILNSLWKNARNARDSSLMNYYSPGAVKIISKDLILNGPEEIFDHYEKLEDVVQISSAYSIDANKDRGITYHLNHYGTIDSKYYVQLVIYQKHGDHKLRAFEFETEVIKSIGNESTGTIAEQITKRREKWMGYCNAHQVKELVNDLYSEHTMYYNHRPVVQGRAALIREYGYMNREQYKLSLEPRFMIYANATTVFEIGQCKGSYNGKYILIWKKEADGQWRIFIDSNV